MRSLRLLLLALVTALSPASVPAEEPKTGPTSLAGVLSLVRYDLPIGLSDGYAPTRQLAVRSVDGKDAVDWPDMTFDGQPIFRERAEHAMEIALRRGADAESPFQARTDHVIEPGNHWLRAMEWRARRQIYTADKTARTANSTSALVGHYELWTFPVRIQGDGAPVVKNVALKYGDAVIYKKDGPWRSLTLLLPAGTYELSVDGRPSVGFTAGLEPVNLGAPREVVSKFDLPLAGDGPAIRVQSLVRAPQFPNQKEWDNDVAALAHPPAVAPTPTRPTGFRHWLGIEAPQSPLLLYAMQLPHGMSSGFYKQGAGGFNGSYSDYASAAAALGFDAVFDQANSLPAPGAGESFEKRAAMLAANGLKLGLQYDNNWNRPDLQHPNIAFFSHTLPEWHAPLYRSLSLAAQRYKSLPNFLGISIGSDNAGYVPYWHWAPPLPDRPWGEAMIEYMGSPEPGMPRPPSLGARELPYEYPVKDSAEFLRHVTRFDATFEQYGYFAEAVRSVDPTLVFTTASFGSAPGAGGRGGWPWASIPGRPMFEGLSWQQAFDWDEMHAALPMHEEALLDRIRSYWPEKHTWALVNNFKGLYGREAHQRACALALTRGVQGLGVNFFPRKDGEGAAPEATAYVAEMNRWMRQYGGVYAQTESRPIIGIFYGQHQALQRRVVTGENPPDAALYAGSHEGKVAEALYFCHAAGLPARVITYQEVLRGPLPSSMKAILLVGLDAPDASWNWAMGLERPLQQFLDQGGRIVADADSYCPVTSTHTAMRVAAYQPQSNLDPSPLLLARNQENIRILRETLRGLPPPVAASADPAIWAIPTLCGDTQYVTVVNQSYADGDEGREMLRAADPKATSTEVWKTKGNASLYVKPAKGKIAWTADRPIYDVRLGRKVSVQEAAAVDLTKDAFQWYALPPAEVSAPVIAISKDRADFYQAIVTVGAQPMRGIPVKITLKNGAGETATVYGASGYAARLPLAATDAAGNYAITATELLSGLTGEASIKIDAPAPVNESIESGVEIHDAAALAKFSSRKNTPLIIALTPAQEENPQISEQARALETYYRQHGRNVTRGSVRPGDVVESLQPLDYPGHFPQWKTVPADLVLFGTAADNVLLLDQARGQLLPRGLRTEVSGAADVAYVRSAFVGECNVVDVIARDPSGIRAAVQTLVRK